MKLLMPAVLVAVSAFAFPAFAADEAPTPPGMGTTMTEEQCKLEIEKCNADAATAEGCKSALKDKGCKVE